MWRWHCDLFASKILFFFFRFSSVHLSLCSENIHNSQAAVTQSNKMLFQSLSSIIVIPIRHLHKYIIHASNPGFRWGDIKCDCVCVWECVCWCVCRWQGNEAAYFVCGLHISDSAEHSPSMRQIYMCCGSNNLKSIVMLTLVYTRIHVALPHDYICVALNKMTHLTLSNNSAVIVAHECEIVFCRQLVHCQGSHSDWAN